MDNAERVDSTVLKAAAVLLVCNSHLEPLYPVKWLAADAVAGVGGGVDDERLAIGRGFGEWYWRRLVLTLSGGGL